MAKLCWVDVMTTQGVLIGDSVKSISIAETTSFLTQRIGVSENRFGAKGRGIGGGEFAARKGREDLRLDKLILNEAAEENF